MAKPFDISIREVTLYFLPVATRVPLKFGPETLTHVTCARVCMEVDCAGTTATGWGETPLSVQWVWPHDVLTYEERHEQLRNFCLDLTARWASCDRAGHALEIGHDFQQTELEKALRQSNLHRDEPMPWLAALVCCSAFDQALHDAYGQVHELPVYDTYTADFLNDDLSQYLEPAIASEVSFAGCHPSDFLHERQNRLPAWHLVGGLDPLDDSELTGSEPNDEYPVVLRDWIRTDGLKCLKIKLRGNDARWDYKRLVRVAEIACQQDASWLSADFNCTVTEPDYVNDVLDRLMHEHPRFYGMILYVEQPFPYDLEENAIDVHSVAARKPLFMDESAHDWRVVRRGRELGWTGVALKTCKTQTGALLSLCWARAHGMSLMVQDLTNPMLAQIPHVLLAAHAGTIMGVETNSMQFYPDASDREASAHQGVYRRRGGELDLSTVVGAGFGYQLDRIERELPCPAASSARL